MSEAIHGPGQGELFSSESRRIPEQSAPEKEVVVEIVGPEAEPAPPREGIAERAAKIDGRVADYAAEVNSGVSRAREAETGRLFSPGSAGDLLAAERQDEQLRYDERLKAGQAEDREYESEHGDMNRRGAEEARRALREARNRSGTPDDQGEASP